MGKVVIKKDDKARILLTEMLPYEVPILFSNEGLYTNIHDNPYYDELLDRVDELSKANGERFKKYGIPFNYEVVKNSDGDTRELSIIHPYNQIRFIELYEKYNSLMLNLCSKSPFSLRKINKVAKYYYSPSFVDFEYAEKDAEREVEKGEDENNEYDSKYLKSYFIYKPLDLIYKFYDSSEYRRLEQRFNLLMELDITKCFYNIYTHSICWAVKDKESSKRNARMSSFENEFDKLMQLANYNETNGIVVGPEVSRIFAEIILQQIDLNVLNCLNKKEIKLGEDYEIRRYVDDFFIFANRESDLELIKKVYQNELKFYKLYLNTHKTDVKTTPFITDITVGKRQLFHLMNGFFTNYIKTSKEGIKWVTNIEPIRKPYYLSQTFIKDFQCIVKGNNIKYDLISKDVLREVKKQIIKVIGAQKTSNENIENVLILLLDIAFYAFSLNINSNTTFKLSQTIVLIAKFLGKRDENIKYSIYSKIHKDIDFVIKNFHRKSKNSVTNIETINLLIAIKKLGVEYQFTQRKLKELFNLAENSDYELLDYFQLVGLIYYIEDFEDYTEIKIGIERAIIKKFSEENDPFSKSEITMLFFDIISCPFVNLKTKKSLLKSSNFCKKNDSNAIMEEVLRKISLKGKWFMDWDTNIDLEKVLKKKEWGLTY